MLQSQTRVLLLGPGLAYGSEGNKSYRDGRRRGAVGPGSVVRLEAGVERVRNRQPGREVGLRFL